MDWAPAEASAVLCVRQAALRDLRLLAGSARLDSALFGHARLHLLRLGCVRPHPLGSARLGSARLFSAAVGEIRPCSANAGLACACSTPRGSRPAKFPPRRRRGSSLPPGVGLPGGGPEAAAAAEQRVGFCAVGPGLAEPWVVPRVPRACPQPVADFPSARGQSGWAWGRGASPRPPLLPREEGWPLDSPAPWRVHHPGSATSRPWGGTQLLHLFPLASVSPSVNERTFFSGRAGGRATRRDPETSWPFPSLGLVGIWFHLR